MAPDFRARSARAVWFVLPALLMVATPAHALRIVNWNLTNYPSVLFPARQPYFRTVLAPLSPDVMVCQEVLSQAGVDSFRTNVLNVNEPGQWASAPFYNGNDTDNMLFYKPAKVELLGSWAFYPNPANLLRYVVCYRLRPIGYTNVELRIYSTHLKASTGSTNEAQRAAEAQGIRDSMNAMPPGVYGMVCGDFNVYTSAEGAYQKLIENEVNNTGRIFDVLPAGAWHNTASFATIHTQCPCVTCPAGSGFSGGGLDDRFDMFLPTYNLSDGQGMDILPSTYVPIGNDGLHFNLNITDPPTIPEGAAYANALWNASDHLPIRADFQLPSRLALAPPSAIAFGTVITGAAASQNLSIANPATLPADGLDYSLAASAGFSAPGGASTVAAGAPADVRAISMDTSTPGTPSGTLTVTSDDPDHASASLTLGGTVLAHAVASLDSLTTVLETTLDFGSHEAGAFTDQMTRAHDQGWNALQARLALNAAAISGPDAARWSIVGGFSPSLVSAPAATLNLHFDDTGATADQDYDALLTLSSTDEPLPGAAAQPDMLVHLHAHVTSGTTGVPGPTLPTVTRLYPPAPNPAIGTTMVRFDLARSGPVRVELFDLSGRRAATIAGGSHDAGAYAMRWDGTLDNGAPAGAGLYFVRLSGPGLRTQTVRLAVVR